MPSPIQLVAVAFLLLPFGAQCQVYRCNEGGKTVYSQIPCVGTTKQIATAGTTKGDSPPQVEGGDNPIALGKALCAANGPIRSQFKDPESVRIGTVSGGQAEPYEVSGTKVIARRYYVPVNAKNSYGAYEGEKPMICYTSQDGRRIIGRDWLSLQ